LQLLHCRASASLCDGNGHVSTGPAAQHVRLWPQHSKRCLLASSLTFLSVVSLISVGRTIDPIASSGAAHSLQAPQEQCRCCAKVVAGQVHINLTACAVITLPKVSNLLGLELSVYSNGQMKIKPTPVLLDPYYAPPLCYQADPDVPGYVQVVHHRSVYWNATVPRSFYISSSNPH